MDTKETDHDTGSGAGRNEATARLRQECSRLFDVRRACEEEKCGACQAATSGEDDTTNENAACGRPYNVSESSSRSTFHVEGTVTNMVPAIDSFSRKDANSKKTTALNPGSRMSPSVNTANAGSISHIDDNESLSMLSHYNVHESKRPTKALNPGSCASALSLYVIKFEVPQRDMRMSDITQSFDNFLSFGQTSSLPSNNNNSGGLLLRRCRSTLDNNGKRNAEWGDFK
jgi:hypothetical protein